MNRKEVMDVFESLAQSQGMYGRMIRAIREAEERGDVEVVEDFFSEFENCEDAVDVILKFEC